MTIFITLLLLTLIFTFPNITWKEDLQLLILLITLLGFRRNKKIATGIMALTFLFLIFQLFDPYVTSLRSGLVDYALYFNILRIIVFTLLAIICILYFKYRKLNLKLSAINYQLSTIAVVIILLLTGTTRIILAYHYNKTHTYKKAILLNPIYTEAHFNLGKDLYEKGDWERASQRLKIILRLKPSFSEAYSLLIATYKKGEMWDELIKKYKPEFKANPDSKDAYNNLALTYTKLKMQDDLTLLIRKHKVPVIAEFDNAADYYELGHGYFNNKMLDEALNMFKKASLLDPANLNIHFQIAKTYARKKMFKEAVEEFKKIVGIAPPAEYKEIQDIDNKTLVSFFINMLKAPLDIRNYVNNFSSPELLRLLEIAGVKIVTNGEIGLTGVKTPVSILAQSAGWDVGNFAHIFVNGKDIFPKGSNRGYTIAVINQETGKVEDIVSFDTYDLKKEACKNMVSFIERIPNKRIIIAVVRDEGTWRLTEAAFISLKSIGANENLSGNAKCSHTIIGVKGAKPGEILETWDKRFGNPVGIIVLSKGV